MNLIYDRLLPNESDSYIRDILEKRGIKDVKNFLRPTSSNYNEPLLLKNCEWGVNLLKKHISNRSNITIIQDCDCDGLTSFAIMWNYLYDNFGIEANYLIHENKQHGAEKLSWIPKNTDLLIIPDASSNEPELLRSIQEEGIDVLVIDHHLISVDNEGICVINNQDGSYPNTTLSGAGVVFKFLQQVDKEFGINSVENYIDLAAVGCIGDVMDLSDLETHYIVERGLNNIRNNGLKTFISKQTFSIKDPDNLTPIDIAFYIVPLVNAIIRVGSNYDKEILLKAFIKYSNEAIPSTKRGRKPGDTEIVAEQAFRLATNAKNRQKKMKEKAVELIKLKVEKEELNSNKILIVPLNDFESSQVDSNLTGLIAMELVNYYNKPVILVRKTIEGDFKGSIRSDTLFFPNFKDFLVDTKCFTYVEGHEAAAGCAIKSGREIERFINKANEELKDYDFSEKTYFVDYSFDSSEEALIYKLAKEIGSYEKLWGKGIEEPYVEIKNIPINENYILMGETKNSFTKQVGKLSLVKFKDEDFIETYLNNFRGTMDVIGRINKNLYMGQTSYQLIIEDVQLHKREKIKF